jgi:amidase
MRRLIPALLAISIVAARADAQRPSLDLVETTIPAVHAALRSGAASCHGVVQGYLDRIAAYDKTGPAINSLIVVNPRALAVADSLDRYASAGGRLGALHCIPIIVKDNFQTTDLPTTASARGLTTMSELIAGPVLS